MITNFEQYTKDLTEDELKMVNDIVRGFKQYTEENPIKAPEIIKRMNDSGYKMTQPKLRKFVNHIRSNGLLPLIATSKGYFVSYDEDKIKDQMRSLYERASAIRNSADGLATFVKLAGDTP